MTNDLSENFRLAMRRLAATVTVLTVVRDGKPLGMAATAVCSLSFDPPSILACINKSASLHEALTGAEHFGVNVLTVEQAAIANRFADPQFRETRFEGFDWQLHNGEVPIIAGSQASLVCVRKGPLEHGSHSILVGEVIYGDVKAGVNPLLYADGNFARHLLLGK